MSMIASNAFPLTTNIYLPPERFVLFGWSMRFPSVAVVSAEVRRARNSVLNDAAVLSTSTFSDSSFSCFFKLAIRFWSAGAGFPPFAISSSSFSIAY